MLAVHLAGEIERPQVQHGQRVRLSLLQQRHCGRGAAQLFPWCQRADVWKTQSFAVHAPDGYLAHIHPLVRELHQRFDALGASRVVGSEVAGSVSNKRV